MTIKLTPDAARLMAHLERVVDPCSLSMGNPMSICDMGFVEELRVEGGVVSVMLCLTDPGCINYATIRQFITDVLMEVPEVASVEVRLSTTELWTPDRLRPTPAVHPLQFVRTPGRAQDKRGAT
jgi:metal-sulfur cluster biosynthetic enzyme